MVAMVPTAAREAKRSPVAKRFSERGGGLMRTHRRVRNIVPILVLFSTLVVVGPAQAVPSCRGEEATIVGTDGHDEIRGTNGDDVIVARGGRDLVEGRGGDDLICLGKGARGHHHRDRGVGGRGSDSIFGGQGPDELHGGPGDDRLFGGGSHSRFYELLDTINGGRGNDLLDGGRQRDRMYGQGGADILRGDGDDDALIGGPGPDAFRGGEGWDVANFQSMDEGSLLVDLRRGIARGQGRDSLSSISEVWSGLEDTEAHLLGDNSANGFQLLTPEAVIEGRGGADWIVDHYGVEMMDGGSGPDKFFASWTDASSDVRGGPGNDRFSAGVDCPPGESVIDLDAGHFTCGGAETPLASIENVFGTSGGDTIIGTDGPNRIWGGNWGDSIYGQGGPDVLDGGRGTDLLDGGPGYDKCSRGETVSSCN
jgi:Ca2+-binding RTX toxin-like protein